MATGKTELARAHGMEPKSYWRCNGCQVAVVSCSEEPPQQCISCGHVELEAIGADELPFPMTIRAIVGLATPSAERLVELCKSQTPGPLVAIAALEMAKRELIAQIAQRYATEHAENFEHQLQWLLAGLDRLDEENEALGPFFRTTERGQG